MELKKAVRTAQTYAAPLLDAKSWGQRKLLRLRRAPSDSCYRAFERLLIEDGKQFLDIGANRGQTIDSFRLYQRSAPVIAFEPNTYLANRLINRYSDDRMVSIQPFGLGREAGYFDLFVPHYRGFMFDGLASFDYTSAHDWLNADRIYRFDRRKLSIENLRCEVRRWDDFATNPGLVKIDVQGHEANVLEGGLETIRKHRPIFLMENGNDHEHETILFKECYRRASYADSHMMMDKLGEKNTFYVPNEKAEAIEFTFN